MLSRAKELENGNISAILRKGEKEVINSLTSNRVDIVDANGVINSKYIQLFDVPAENSKFGRAYTVAYFNTARVQDEVSVDNTETMSN